MSGQWVGSSLPSSQPSIRAHDVQPARPVPRVAAIIVAHNSAEIIESCLRGLHEDGYPNLETIIVDCASSDGTVALVGELAREAKVVTLDQDPGFAEACLIGARATDAEYLLWVNTDVVLSRQTVGRLVNAISDQVKVAAATQYDWHGKLTNWGNPFPMFPMALARIVTILIKGGSPEPFYVGSACSLMKRSTFEAIPFQPSMEFYEDLEWGWRLQLAGFQQVVVRGTAVFHKKSAQLSRSPKLARVYGRNMILAPILCAPGWLAMAILPGMVGFWLSLLVKYLLSEGNGMRFVRLSIKGVTEIASRIDLWRALRREIRSSRSVSDLDLLSRAARSFAFHESMRLAHQRCAVPPSWLAMNGGQTTRPPNA